MTAKYLVKLFSPWHTRDLIFGEVCFSPTIDLAKAHAALWEYWPNEEIIAYPKPKAWYSWEPRWHSQYRTPLIRRIRSALSDSEWLHYAHPDPYYRVPHITNCGLTDFYENTERLSSAVAIVSNSGGKYWFLRPGLRLRNKFVTHHLVKLFGRRKGWEDFRKFGPFSSSAIPSNYCGELDWRNVWMAEQQVKFLNQYRVAVCLENSIESYYFTEKFFNAARSGCIPVYHAHPTVRNGILGGAFWIDPADYGFDVPRTIEAALAAPLQEVHSMNRSWMAQPNVQASHFNRVWVQLAAIFTWKINNCSIART